MKNSVLISALSAASFGSASAHKGRHLGSHGHRNPTLMEESLVPATQPTAENSTIAPRVASSSSNIPSLAWKAGLSGYPGIQTLDVFTSSWAPYISWYSNYEPVAPNIAASDHTVVGAPMLWGKGDQCLNGADGPVDQQRYNSFVANVQSGDTQPEVFFGFYEPDCACDSSSHIPDVTLAAQKWTQWIAPLRSRGIALGSPPMCTQLDQTWLTEFSAILGVAWDVTSIHVNKPTVAEGISVVEYYANKFGKPVWVSEFTCVDDQTWSSCGDQSAVNAFIDGMVDYFEGNDNVVAYGANNGEGVPGVWNLMTSDWPPQLTATGLHYQSKLKSLLDC